MMALELWPAFSPGSLKPTAIRGTHLACTGAFQPSDRHMELIQKMRTETATEQERSKFRHLHERRAHEILEKDQAELFKIESIEIELPSKAKIEPSKVCDKCGEPTMASKLQQRGNSLLCRSCIETGAGGRRIR